MSIEGEREGQLKKCETTKLEVEPEGKGIRTIGKETEVDNVEGCLPYV